jgi:hypothetical protein
MRADWKYTNKMYYHTVALTLYEFEDVFAERKIGDTVQFWSILHPASLILRLVKPDPMDSHGN